MSEKDEDTDIFQPTYIVVSSLTFGSWLKKELTVKNGIVSNTSFIMINKLFELLYMNNTGEKLFDITKLKYLIYEKLKDNALYIAKKTSIEYIENIYKNPLYNDDTLITEILNNCQQKTITDIYKYFISAIDIKINCKIHVIAHKIHDWQFEIITKLSTFAHIKYYILNKHHSIASAIVKNCRNMTDEINSLFKTCLELNTRDVLVIAPNIELYLPYIKMVFDNHHIKNYLGKYQPIPYNIISISHQTFLIRLIKKLFSAENTKNYINELLLMSYQSLDIKRKDIATILQWISEPSAAVFGFCISQELMEQKNTIPVCYQNELIFAPPDIDTTELYLLEIFLSLMKLINKLSRLNVTKIEFEELILDIEVFFSIKIANFANKIPDIYINQEIAQEILIDYEKSQYKNTRIDDCINFGSIDDMQNIPSKIIYCLGAHQASYTKENILSFASYAKEKLFLSGLGDISHVYKTNIALVQDALKPDVSDIKYYLITSNVANIIQYTELHLYKISDIANTFLYSNINLYKNIGISYFPNIPEDDLSINKNAKTIYQHLEKQNEKLDVYLESAGYISKDDVGKAQLENYQNIYNFYKKYRGDKSKLEVTSPINLADEIYVNGNNIIVINDFNSTVRCFYKDTNSQIYKLLVHAMVIKSIIVNTKYKNYNVITGLIADGKCQLQHVNCNNIFEKIFIFYKYSCTNKVFVNQQIIRKCLLSNIHDEKQIERMILDCQNERFFDFSNKNELLDATNNIISIVNILRNVDVKGALLK